jgi:hypothetical protein
MLGEAEDATTAKKNGSEDPPLQRQEKAGADSPLVRVQRLEKNGSEDPPLQRLEKNGAEDPPLHEAEVV